jgi:hypothetical protein
MNIYNAQGSTDIKEAIVLSISNRNAGALIRVAFDASFQI